MRVRRSVLVCVLIAVPFFHGALRAERPRLPADETLVVRLHRGMGPKVVGDWVASDAETLTVRNRYGREVRVDWDSVRSIKTKNRNAGLWAGMLAGAAVAGAALAADGGDAGPAGAAFVGAGACMGGALGRLSDQPRETLYKAPSGEAAPWSK